MSDQPLPRRLCSMLSTTWGVGGGGMNRGAAQQAQHDMGGGVLDGDSMDSGVSHRAAGSAPSGKGEGGSMDGEQATAHHA